MNDANVNVENSVSDIDMDWNADRCSVTNDAARAHNGEDDCLVTLPLVNGSNRDTQSTGKHKTPPFKVNSRSCVQTESDTESNYGRCDSATCSADDICSSDDSTESTKPTRTVVDKLNPAVNHPTGLVAAERRKKSPIMTAWKMSVSFVAGCVFGMAIQKGAVYEPRVIRAQFIYEKFIMLKMFLSAVSLGAVCIALTSIIPGTRLAFERAYKAFIACVARKGVIGVVIGGFLLGAGMTVAGACPGMVLVQVGTWVGKGSALMTLLGCLVGVFTYGIFGHHIDKFFAPKKTYEKHAIVQWVNLPFAVLAVAMALVTGGIVVLLEWFFPWKEELHVSNTPVSWFFELLAWPPYVAGILIGMMQVPIILALGETLGSVSSYCTIVSQLLITKSLESKVPYLAAHKRGIHNWWQVFYVCGAIFGGGISAFASDSLGSVPGVSLPSSFIGGFLMVFGSRMAGGCTSGHGLSGVGLLMALSMLAAAAMFVGGTIIGFICLAMDKADLIDYYTF